MTRCDLHSPVSHGEAKASPWHPESEPIRKGAEENYVCEAKMPEDDVVIIPKTVQEKKIAKLLSKAGLTEDDFQFYLQQFVSNRHPYLVPYYRFGRKFCRGQDEGLSNYQVARHLAGLADYGLARGKETDFFIIDIDFKDHSTDGNRDFHRRLEQVIRLFPAATLIQSSQSGGVHVYQFLDHPEPTTDIHQYVQNRLKNNGMEIKAGGIEVFTHQPIRLPFGKCSYVLDPDRLIRLTNNRKEDIWHIRNISDRLTLDEVFTGGDLIHAEHLIHTEHPIPTENITPTHPNLFISSVSISTGNDISFIKHCEMLLDEGLTRQGTRYFACSDLIEYFMFHIGYDPEQTYGEVVDWLTRKHNGFSNQYNDRPESVFRLILSQIKWFTRVGPVKLRRTGLSHNEVNLVLQEGLTYDEQCFLFDLFRWWKKHYGNNSTARIASRTFWNFRGTSHRTYVKRRQKAFELGYLQKLSGHIHDPEEGTGEPILYRILIKFDVDPKFHEFFDLDEAIITLLTPQEIKERYTSYRARYLLSLLKGKKERKEA